MAALQSAIAPALPPWSPQGAGEQPWWTRAAALSAALAQSAAARVCYRFGDGVLEIASDSPALTRELEDRYGECAVRGTAGGASPSVRCSVRSCGEGRLALVRFNEPASVDAFGVALTLLEHPAAHPLFAERASGADGWRIIACASTGIPVLAARGTEALVDCKRSPRGFLVDLIVNPVLAAQRELLFVHAASVGIRGAGILLIGPSGSGKTTTSLTLASRGHTYFGDDMAALRAASAELVAFRRTASLRPGPHALALARHVETGRWDPPHADGIRRLRLCVADLFPAAAAAPLPLRLALVLRRFAAAPAVEPFAPTLEALGASSPLALNNALWLAWGTTPQRRLLQFMLFVRMLTRVRCAWLDVGAPDATADLIETLTEDAWD